MKRLSAPGPQTPVVLVLLVVGSVLLEVLEVLSVVLVDVLVVVVVAPFPSTRGTMLITALFEFAAS